MLDETSEKKIYEDSLKWAKKMMKDLFNALEYPDSQPLPETQTLLADFKKWDLLEKIKTAMENKTSEDKEFINVLVRMLAKEKYKTLRFEKENPQKKKLSKWELVTGQRLNK